MTNYKVEFVKSAQKELSKLPPQTSLKIVKAIYKLSIDPRDGNVRPMVGTKSWRLRIGDYRVIYDIYDKKTYNLSYPNQTPQRGLPKNLAS